MKKINTIFIFILIINSQLLIGREGQETSKQKLVDNISEIQKLAERGLPMAQHLLGLYYKLGDHSLPKDESRAIYWITKAASQGNVSAQECLMRYYRDENIDAKQSWYWGLEAAHRGSGEAMRVLAGYAIQGVNCEKSLRECTKWLFLSASAGDLAAKEWLYELDYRLNIYETIEFFDAYHLAHKWLNVYRIPGLKIEEEFFKKFNNLQNIIN